jgi:hypothetical protein
MRRLQAAGVEVWGHDFVTPEKVIADLGARSCGLEEGFEGADGVVIANNHPQYLRGDIPGLAARLRRPAFLLDAWSLFEANDFRAVGGLRYGALGSPFERL